MRCLTLAEALREMGARCRMICRSHPGNLIKEIRQRGFDVVELPFDGSGSRTEVTHPPHASWLGADWKTDAEQTKVGAGETAVDWLIVDHYAIDARWERALAQNYRRLMVIDDLADRPHLCDLLLDQTFSRAAADYSLLVPADCRLLCGAQFAMLRPEFAAMRSYSIKRRVQPVLRELLISMGGVDMDNATEQVMQALLKCPLPADCRITVVMGVTAPWLKEVRTRAQDMPWPTRVLVDVKNMAQLMADSDLAIGAAGSTAWELCCLGVPNLLVCTAANQRTVIGALASVNATARLDRAELSQLDGTPFCAQYAALTENIKAYAASASRITDGSGASRVFAELASIQ